MQSGSFVLTFFAERGRISNRGKKYEDEFIKTVGALALVASMPLCGCVSQAESSSYTKEDYALQMNVDFPSCDDLPDGNGKAAKVFLLLGQSNASGCSIVEYLQL